MISNHGRVRSLKRHGDRIMPMTVQPSGRNGKLTYYAVTLWMHNKAICRKVHRMVAEAFIPNPDNLPQINHKDGNKLNNHADNLEWCTAKQNARHAYDTGLAHGHRLTEEEKQHLRDLWKGRKLSEETKSKLSAALKGRPRPDVSARLKGKSLSRKAIEASIAARKRKAEERRMMKALQPKRPVGRPRKNPSPPI